VVGVGDEIASVLSGSDEWECNCGKRSEREAQEKAEPGQLIAFLSKWKASIPVETDLTTANDIPVENELQLEINETATPPGGRLSNHA